MRVFAPFQPIFRDPALGLAAGLLILFGAHMASMLPQMSAMAVAVFDLSDQAYSVILLAAAVVAVSSSVVFGIAADQRGRRRDIALFCAGAMTLGNAIVALIPSPAAFVVSQALLLPLASSLFGQLFALGRLAASLRPQAERGTIQTTLRALFALPWVVVLPIWSVVFERGADQMVIFPICLAISGTMFLLVIAFWPRDGATRWPDPKSGLKFRDALAEMADRRIIGRVIALGAINSTIVLYMVLVGLVFLHLPNRGASDVAIYAGVIAGLEVPLMLALPVVAAQLSRMTLILCGTILYALHLALLPILAATDWVWALTILAAAGGAVILTQPMAYLQDLLGTRPGAGASLLSLQTLIGDTVAAAIFAIGAGFAGYGVVAILGASVAVLACVSLWSVDRQSTALA
ncbi:hypothetical protein BFP70_00350 [Thioclava sp. SK-1]|uniref:MFS transporter n=1 Tax=Thioclava sp. SK-1 TaxID=1889770 RepID=UPI000824DF82|nr:MFS transporter [Thioclava sp. SK-1]OCX66652.1 hypothetical protein BFP70_00350 [Thioclava sp. SK-1]